MMSDVKNIFDISGKLVLNQSQSVSEGQNNLNLNFSSLPTGSYIVKLGNNVNPTYRKLIIE